MITLLEYEALVLVQNGADMLSALEEQATFKHKIRARVESLCRSGHLASSSKPVASSQITITLKGKVAVEEVDRFIEQVRQTF